VLSLIVIRDYAKLFSGHKISIILIPTREEKNEGKPKDEHDR
jgi:hypothetical protein